jgi:hypothetical protein
MNHGTPKKQGLVNLTVLALFQSLVFSLQSFKQGRVSGWSMSKRTNQQQGIHFTSSFVSTIHGQTAGQACLTMTSATTCKCQSNRHPSIEPPCCCLDDPFCVETATACHNCSPSWTDVFDAQTVAQNLHKNVGGKKRPWPISNHSVSHNEPTCTPLVASFDRLSLVATHVLLSG